MRPSLIPTSALMMPQWSSTTAPVITRSGAPSARVARDWPIDSRMTFPPPNTASSPPAQRSCSTSMNRSVSASRTRSPAVGPYSSAYRDRLSSVIELLLAAGSSRIALSPTGLSPTGLAAAAASPSSRRPSSRRPGTTRAPASGTRLTSRSMPGSKRTAVQAAMLSRCPHAASRSNDRAGLACAKW